ncbi:MAG: type II secretion system protein [Phycisphaeraceae bacterium]|nr:MAG: type II secretion system protein [Phycisphaeraceae bacterium]
MGRVTRRRAFTLVELLIVVAVAAMLLAIAFPAVGVSRTAAGLEGSRANLRQMGVANGEAAAENDGLIAGYDWEGHGGSDPPLYDLGGGDAATASDNLVAAQLQQAAICRKATGRFDASGPRRLPVNYSRLPHRRYNHLPLADDLGGGLPEPTFVSPLDVHHQEFQANPYDFADLPAGLPQYCEADSSWTTSRVVKYWAYGSSYQCTYYAWTTSRPDEYGNLGLHPSDGGSLLVVDPSRLGRQPMADVAFPALKVFYHEEYDYSEGSGNAGRYYADPEASVNVLFFDGSVRRVATADANPGWDAGAPCDMTASADLLYESIDTRYFPTYDGNPNGNTYFPGCYKWTRGGLEGVDTGGDETDTSTWCD